MHFNICIFAPPQEALFLKSVDVNKCLREHQSMMYCIEGTRDESNIK